MASAKRGFSSRVLRYWVSADPDPYWKVQICPSTKWPIALSGRRATKCPRVADGFLDADRIVGIGRADGPGQIPQENVIRRVTIPRQPEDTDAFLD